MLRRPSLRLYLYVLVAAALIVLLFSVPNTRLHENTKTYVKGVLGVGEDKPVFNSDKWFYQSDLDQQPVVYFDHDRLANLPPVNWHGPGRPTFATFYASRDASMMDPYFSAAQSIVYRLLWKQKSRSTKFPVTVFVAPFVEERQRQYFTDAGAMVRELPLRPFTPDMKGVPARLQDMFSKLEMWRQTDFSRIAYFDCDAIPLDNIDDIFDSAVDQFCKPDLLPPEDLTYGNDICEYAFAAHPEGEETINAGVMIFKPQTSMHGRLVRGSSNHTGWDTGYLEQSLISYMYNPFGPFPPSILPPQFNSFPEYKEKHIRIKILHDKMWAHYFDHGTWMETEWKDTWTEMDRFYRSEEFYKARINTRDHVAADLKQEAERRPKVKPPDMLGSIVVLGNVTA